MKKVILSMAAVAVLALSSCSLTTPVAATSNSVGSKVGSAKTTMILSVFYPDGGDASIATAAKNGGIQKISTVDFTYANYLGIYGFQETTVTGE